MIHGGKTREGLPNAAEPLNHTPTGYTLSASPCAPPPVCTEMLAQARQLIRTLTATLVAVMLVMICPCEPCGPGAAIAMAPAGVDAHESASTGCCPGDADSDSEDGTRHLCAHCDADAAVQASADTQTVYATAPQPVPPTALPPTAALRSASWAASAQPPVVRRASGPPPYVHVIPTPTRLALLATLRC